MAEKSAQKVAICHSTLETMGGAERVGATLVEALNEAGITPDIFITVPSPNVGRNHLNYFYGKDLKFRLVSFLPFRVKTFGVYQKIIGSSCTFRLANYDVVVSTGGDFSPMLFSKLLPRCILYMYAPSAVMLKNCECKAQVASDSNYTKKHEKSLFWKIYYKPHRIISEYAMRTVKGEFLAVSKFTKWRLEKYAGLKSRVVYPPVDLKRFSAIKDNRNRNGVISIARFDPLKNQFVQLKIAKKLPNIKFRICGSTNIPEQLKWFEYLKSKANEMQIKNVEFYPNVEFTNLLKLIGQSKIFVHTMRYEDFGLTTCEATAGGCIPCVIDSGGQKEVVPFRNLRFRSPEEAVRIINKIDNQDNTELKEKLSKHIKQFDETQFKRNMLELIKERCKSTHTSFSPTCAHVYISRKRG